MPTTPKTALKKATKKTTKKKNKQISLGYNDAVMLALSRCGGKSKPKVGDIREFAGYLSEILASNTSARAAFVKNGHRRNRK